MIIGLGTQVSDFRGVPLLPFIMSHTSHFDLKSLITALIVGILCWNCVLNQFPMQVTWSKRMGHIKIYRALKKRKWIMSHTSQNVTCVTWRVWHIQKLNFLEMLAVHLSWLYWQYVAWTQLTPFWHLYRYIFGVLGFKNQLNTKNQENGHNDTITIRGWHMRGSVFKICLQHL